MKPSSVQDGSIILPLIELTYPHLQYTEDPDHRQNAEYGPEGGAQAPRPGGILIVSVLSGLSGAVMGLLFGGYLTAALATLIATPLGIAIGIWVKSLKD